MVMKQPEVTAKTRNRLRRAFWMLYERQPIEKITVRQITDLAGYNRATFYMYYTSVLDLREHVEDDFIARRITAMRDVIVDFSDPDSIRINLAAFLDQSAKDKPFLKVLLGPHGDPAFVEKMKEAVKPFMMPLIERNIGKDAAGRNAEYVREFYFSGVLAVVRRWLTDPDPMPTEDLLELIVGVFMPDVSVE
ncbi:TetR-type transcriptional regulator [Bifidobacterium lemurum]|uniref:TetR-type transcriptional regulator n=1 Tax=Bifidobacterium lemurum TaxID=1603886 RepID=A0A261FM90_9BIFI|nr:TetR-like C-terminal domain-containing protein [Bifidobacterium lemurum]OZG60257.1 TetR-type transcriptional regulator [Bifidobacterium lemurum]QOL34149.1 TetR/AcrR family transcriptional regulator [Bifidobacterium lemurum]